MKQQAVAAGSDAADAWYNSEEAVAALKQTGDSAGVARALAALPAGQRTSYLAAAADAGAANPGVAMLFLQVLPQPGGVLVVCRWRAGGGGGSAADATAGPGSSPACWLLLLLLLLLLPVAVAEIPA